MLAGVGCLVVREVVDVTHDPQREPEDTEQLTEHDAAPRREEVERNTQPCRDDRERQEHDHVVVPLARRLPGGPGVVGLPVEELTCTEVHTEPEQGNQQVHPERLLGPTERHGVLVEARDSDEQGQTEVARHERPGLVLPDRNIVRAVARQTPLEEVGDQVHPVWDGRQNEEGEPERTARQHGQQLRNHDHSKRR